MDFIYGFPFHEHLPRTHELEPGGQDYPSLFCYLVFLARHPRILREFHGQQPLRRHLQEISFQLVRAHLRLVEDLRKQVGVEPIDGYHFKDSHLYLEVGTVLPLQGGI